MGQSTHGSRYVKGCQCDGCAAQRARARARSRAHPDKGDQQRRRYKTEKQREYNARRLAETGQSYYQANREEVIAKAKDRYARWRAANPRSPRLSARPGGRHGAPDEWARMYEAQGGLCYLCLRPLPDDRSAIDVDHDHTCCDPGPKGRDTHSCQHCRRGLTHDRCNQIWGLAKEDADLLRTMAINGERVRDETVKRIAAKSYVQGALL